MSRKPAGTVLSSGAKTANPAQRSVSDLCPDPLENHRDHLSAIICSICSVTCKKPGGSTSRLYHCDRFFIYSFLFILHRVIPMSSDMGYRCKKGTSLHRGYNPAMKNKRSDTPEVCSVKVQICGKLSWPICAGTASACGSGCSTDAVQNSHGFSEQHAVF